MTMNRNQWRRKTNKQTKKILNKTFVLPNPQSKTPVRTGKKSVVIGLHFYRNAI